MNHITPAFNYTPFVNEAALVVKRKGHVIKGETDAAIAAAHKERRLQVNAAKRERRSRRGK